MLSHTGCHIYKSVFPQSAFSVFFQHFFSTDLIWIAEKVVLTFYITRCDRGQLVQMFGSVMLID